MRDTRIQGSLLLRLVILVSSIAACVNTEIVDPQLDSIPTDHENRPFHVAIFDHSPTEEEIQIDLTQFFTKSHDASSAMITPTGPISPQSGQKLVRLDVTTSNIDHAGTDDADRIKFIGIWQATNLQKFAESFVLDNPNLDDLDRNTVSVYFYLLNVQQHVQGLTDDRFIEGQLASTTTNAWHCNNIAIIEQNFLGTRRVQSLPFNQWVEYPSRTPSLLMIGNNSSLLSYY